MWRILWSFKGRTPRKSTMQWITTAALVRRKTKMFLVTVIAGELCCLSAIAYILFPSPPDPNNTGLSGLPHPLPMFSLTPCIYNMLEQPLECKDPLKAISKHRYTCSVIDMGAKTSELIWKDLSWGMVEGNLNWTPKGCGNCKKCLNVIRRLSPGDQV